MGEICANPLTELAEYGDMKQDLMKGKGPVQICGVTDSQKVHVMYQVSEEKAWRLVVTHDDTRARELYDDFSYFEKNTWLYPARDLLFYSSFIIERGRRWSMRPSTVVTTVPPASSIRCLNTCIRCLVRRSGGSWWSPGRSWISGI